MYSRKRRPNDQEAQPEDAFCTTMERRDRYCTAHEAMPEGGEVVLPGQPAVQVPEAITTLMETIKVEKGSLRVWWVRNMPNPGERHPVSSPHEGRAWLTATAEMDLAMPESVVSNNAGGLEVFDGTEWIDWYCECGEEIESCACQSPICSY